MEPNSIFIDAGGNYLVTVTFSPVERGEQVGTITVESDDADEGGLTVSVSGTGLAPEIALYSHC